MCISHRVIAPAKINLGLKVLRKREDGFHGIESIFSTIGLCDELIITPMKENNFCEVFCDSMELPQNNTISATYKAFQQLVNYDLPGMNVSVKKKIPSGGGLGGGSSDGASFLKALNILCDAKLSREQLRTVAAQVGSDVFFFLDCDESGNGAALVSGRGENVLPIKKRYDLHYLLILPGVHSSTKEAYALVDEFYESGEELKYPAFDDLERVYNSNVKDWTFVNTFTKVITGKYSKVGQAICDLKQAGALYTDMSGSGSTVFGVFASAEEAKKARDKLSHTWNVYACS